MKPIGEIYRDLPGEEPEAAPARMVEELRLGGPLFILFALIVLGFWTVLVPFCSGISR